MKWLYGPGQRVLEARMNEAVEDLNFMEWLVMSIHHGGGSM